MDQNPLLQSIAAQVDPSLKKDIGDPRLQFSVPCFEVEYQQSQAPTLRYVFYDLPFPEIPCKMSFHLVNGWIGGTRQRHQEVKLLRPDGSAHLSTGRQPLEFVDENTPFMAINYLPEIPFDVEGLWQVVVSLEDREVMRYPLTVRQVERPAGG